MGCAIPYKRAGPGMNGRTGWVTPETIHEPRGKSRVYGWRYEKSGFILSLGGPGVPAPTPPTHAHITYKTSYKGKFSEKSDSCLHPHIVCRQPPMTPWWDARAMGRVNARTPGAVTGWGKRADHENNLLDNLHEKGYYPPSK